MTGISAQGDSLVWLTNVIIVGSTHALSASSANQVESGALIHVDGRYGNCLPRLTSDRRSLPFCGRLAQDISHFTWRGAGMTKPLVHAFFILSASTLLTPSTAYRPFFSAFLRIRCT